LAVFLRDYLGNGEALRNRLNAFRTTFGGIRLRPLRGARWHRERRPIFSLRSGFGAFFRKCTRIATPSRSNNPRHRLDEARVWNANVARGHIPLSPSSPPKMPSLLRRFALCACTGAAFILMGALLHKALPLRVPEVSQKVDYLKAHRQDFDTVFIGSSRIYHGVAPKVFDAVMAANGRPTRSFNLGIDGMMPPESIHMARQLVAIHPPRLKTVFLEVATAQDLPDPDDLSVRDIYFQDTDSLVHGARRAMNDLHGNPPDHRWRAAAEDFSGTIQTFVRNEMNIGRLAIEADLGDMPEWLQRSRPSSVGDGYLPKFPTLTKHSLIKLESQVQRIRIGAVKVQPTDQLTKEDYALTRELLNKHGITLVLMTAPVALPGFHAQDQAPPDIRLLSFDNPGLHPELFLPENRCNSDHLNDKGARIFSKELAEAYLSGQ